MKKPAIRPRGYTTVTASLAVLDVAEMLKFLENAFDAEVKVQDTAEAPGFASVKLGNAMVFITNGWAAHGHVPPAPAAASAVSLHLYVEDVTASVEQAVSAGATVISNPQDTFWGERTAALADPFGHRWTVAERVEVMSKEEIAARSAAAVTDSETSEPVDATGNS
ncbi:VOC family protein [Rhodobacteraceae bacterium B1Z28]|uniref:VOC family protein n=1 Tax=Ruegeria haliotis TaxID=2747601 RepID=A0ABX2PTD3_9RHOB|nr:VOC family protein [Ruegeria haliotis]NVO57429.1 VOC family protein [Ruegeria haliotis]